MSNSLLTRRTLLLASSGILGFTPIFSGRILAEGQVDPKVMATPLDLPALPFATGAKVMGLGHSFVANSGFTTIYPGNPVPRIDTLTAGWSGTIGPLRNIDNRFNLDAWYDPGTPTSRSPTARFAGAIAGIGGEHMPQTLNRLSWCLERRPDIIILDIGTNDINSDRLTDIQAIARYEAILGPIRIAGVYVICLLPIDRPGTKPGLWGPGDPRHAVSIALADYIASLGGRAGVKVVDDRAALAKAAASGLQVLEDGVHLSPAGQWVRYSILLPILRSMVTPGDFYQRDDQAPDNLSPLGGLRGSSGLKSGLTGSVADGLSAVKNVGQRDKIVATKEMLASDLSERQVFTIIPDDNTNKSRVSSLTLSWPDMNFEALGLKVGDWIEAGLDYELSASNDWLGLEFALEGYSDDNVARQTATGGMWVRLNTLQDGPHLTEPLAGRAIIPSFQLLETDSVAVPATHFRTSLRPIRLHWKKQSTDRLVAKFSLLLIRKSKDPRPAWNL